MDVARGFPSSVEGRIKGEKMNFIDKLAALFWFITYPVSVEIYEERANALLIFNDRARRVHTGRTEQYHLAKRNKLIPPPKFKNIFMNHKGKNLLKLFLPQTGQYLPIGFQHPSPTLTVEDKDVRFWFTQEAKERARAYTKQSKWEKYMPYILLTTMAMMIFLQVLFFYKGIGAMTGSMNSAARTFKEAVQIATEFSGKVTGKVP